MIEGIHALGLASLPWLRDVEVFRARSEWLRRTGLITSAWPDLSDEQLLTTMETWLGPFLHGITRRVQLAQLDLLAIVRSMFTYQQLKELDRLAPATLKVPTGSQIRINYAGPQPLLPVKLQEMFGQTETPTVGGGTKPVLLHLLSPAGRPLAVTQDLPSFWRSVYPEVRKEMRGRYPKHVWPDDPLSAQPTRRTKKRLK